MKVKVSYQTLQLPPPLAFAYTLEMEFHEEEIKIQYDLEFLNRDEITLEEIEEEGFSENDDYSWTGTLGKAWVEDLYDDLLEVDLEDESEDFNIYLHMEISHDGQEDSGIAVMAEDWDYRLQEVIQAIYEKAGIEDKLKLKFIHQANGERSFYELEGSFEHKTCQINQKDISWDELHQLMSDVYTIDFEGESVEKPSGDGLWIDQDAMSGYQLFDEQAGPKAAKIKSRILDILER
ncbi:hypothetical protein [Marinoscillum sp. 108]|jgi:hypothetical protein|uniref:hypothetical protein n=1 Tax=Marinoscillum sp. 108 TaxID=2653151 RepID=UPI0012EEFA9D|nr:hypothetical protein [Marinoscillum sp. 108]VXD12057.1 conserved hypothetical protein [Marinoscillum sp. 108]